MTVFISCCKFLESHAASFVDALSARGVKFQHSPFWGYGPENETVIREKLDDQSKDPKSGDWYGQGCRSAIQSSAAFVAVVTSGYSLSTWMLHEALEATNHAEKHSDFRSFIFWPEADLLPRGFTSFYELAEMLPSESEAAAIRTLELVDE